MSASEMMMLEEELNELRTEVTRLRGECGQAYLQGVKAGRDAERISERTASVAWLLARAGETANRSPGKENEISLIYSLVADMFERGEHRREEER